MTEVSGFWLDEEVAFLIKYHSVWPAQRIADALGRTLTSVYTKRQGLGLARRYMGALVCKICGEPRYHPCDYALCEEHFLKYRREYCVQWRQKRREIVERTDKAARGYTPTGAENTLGSRTQISQCVSMGRGQPHPSI